MSKNPLHSAGSVCHYTPAPIVEAAREVLGRIHLDPATDSIGQRTVRATVAYTQLGLDWFWHGPVFLNPPGLDKNTNPGGASAWWNKLLTEWTAAERAWDAIYVGFSLEQLQTTQRFQVPHPTEFPTCYFAKRIRFDTLNAAGELVPGNSPTHGNFVTCVTANVDTAERFASVFSRFGVVS